MFTQKKKKGFLVYMSSVNTRNTHDNLTDARGTPDKGGLLFISIFFSLHVCTPRSYVLGIHVVVDRLRRYTGLRDSMGNATTTTPPPPKSSINFLPGSFHSFPLAFYIAHNIIMKYAHSQILC